MPNRCNFSPMALDLILGAKCYFTQILEYQVFTKIFHCASGVRLLENKWHLLPEWWRINRAWTNAMDFNAMLDKINGKGLSEPNDRSLGRSISKSSLRSI